MKDIRFLPGSVLSFQKTVYNDAYLFDGDKVNCFCAAPDGRLYVGAGFGLFFFDGEVFVKFVDILTSVTSVCCDGDTVYAASGRTIYCVRNDRQIGCVTVDHEVAALYCDAESGVVAVTSDGLYAVGEEKAKPLQVDPTYKEFCFTRSTSGGLTSFCNTENGAVVGTTEGLYLFTLHCAYLFGEETLPDGNVNDVFVSDDRKEIWVATDLGICRLQFDSSI